MITGGLLDRPGARRVPQPWQRPVDKSRGPGSWLPGRSGRPAGPGPAGLHPRPRRAPARRGRYQSKKSGPASALSCSPASLPKRSMSSSLYAPSLGRPHGHGRACAHACMRFGTPLDKGAQAPHGRAETIWKLKSVALPSRLSRVSQELCGCRPSLLAGLGEANTPECRGWHL